MSVGQVSRLTRYFYAIITSSMTDAPKSRFRSRLLLFFTVVFVGVTLLSAGAIHLQGNTVYAQGPDEDTTTEEPQTTDNNATQTAADSCEENGGDWAWLFCSVMRLADEGIQQFDTEIRRAIQVDSRFYRDTVDIDQPDGTTKEEIPLQTIWSNVRNIAYILLIPVMLILVIGTALGFSVLDAYTVRRAMPRLLVAVVFIAISYDIGAALIDLSNLAARGIQGMLVASVGADNLSLPNLFGYGEVKAIGGVALGGGIIALVSVGVGALAISVLTSFMLTAAMALMVIFFILTMRQLIIVAILVFLPVAILTWIFPGKDKLWKFTWGIFTAMLWAGPAFAAFTVFGRIAAYIVHQATTGAELELGRFDGVIILLTKLFLIVGSLVGGLVILNTLMGSVGQLTGIINDKSKGFFDRNKKYRQERGQKQYGKFKSGEGTFKFQRKTGEAYGTFAGAEGTMNRVRMLTKRGRQEAASQQRAINQATHADSTRAKVTQNDDSMLQAQTYASAAEARANLAIDFNMDEDEVERAIAAAKQAGGFSAAKQDYAARQLSKTGTGYANIGQVQSTVARVANGNRSMAAGMLGEINSTTKGAGRHDLATGFGNQMNMYDMLEARAKNGGSATLTAEEQAEAHAIAGSDIDAYTLSKQKGGAIKNMSQGARYVFEEAEQRGGQFAGSAIVRQPDVDDNGKRVPPPAHSLTEWTRHIDKIEQIEPNSSTSAAGIMQNEVVQPTSGRDETGALRVRQEEFVDHVPTKDETTGAVTWAPRKRVIDVADGGRPGVHGNLSPNLHSVDPTTGNFQREVLRDQDGRMVVNPYYNEAQKQQYGAPPPHQHQQPQTLMDPSDPRRLHENEP